jgi:hypothetical protein
MAFEDIEQALKAGKVISVKDIKSILTVAKKAKEQNPNWKAGEFQEMNGLSSWVELPGSIDDIQYKVAMGHILSRDEIKFCLLWARKYISDYANEPQTPVIATPVYTYTVAPSAKTTFNYTSGAVPYHSCAICYKHIDGVIDHYACIQSIANQVP